MIYKKEVTFGLSDHKFVSPRQTNLFAITLHLNKFALYKTEFHKCDIFDFYKKIKYCKNKNTIETIKKARSKWLENKQNGGVETVKNVSFKIK